MRRTLLVIGGLLVFSTASAGPLDVSAPGVQTLAALMPGSPRVYPPLPTLAMLPPSTGDDELPAKPSAKKSRKARLVADCRCDGPEPRLVVSGESRSYMKDIEQRLDAALIR
ncbi:hypothetical protein [Caballeronia sp. GAFFF2]|uniref:hypothetical protein n=1 Tax=Caballeronia sp. GAFFF2 TaxID=2921741 RepID=UPI002027BB0D|nr:hypothetical protein [Caballeronia sp. GAFFF2]